MNADQTSRANTWPEAEEAIGNAIHSVRTTDGPVVEDINDVDAMARAALHALHPRLRSPC